MLSVRTFRFGSESGSSLSHFPKARTANVGGMCCTSQGLTVEGQTNKLDGSKADVGGGDGLFELFMRAL